MHDITLPSEAAQDLLRRVRALEASVANVLQVNTAYQAEIARLKRRVHDLEVFAGLEIKPPLPEDVVVLQDAKRITSRSSQKLARIIAKAEEAPEKEPKP